MQTPTAIESLQKLRDDDITVIPADNHLDGTVHQWSRRETDAITLALKARRPLLVRGEPGTGKSQLARAAAHVLGWMLHAETISPRFEPSDLMYRFDAIKRLADAQAQRLQEDCHYWEPGPLWKAFDWSGAHDYGGCRIEPKPAQPTGHIVLIDEIDKADSDLPNSLLEVLGQRSFRIPALGLQIGTPSDRQPLILITTNEDRELPPAFMRRCVVLCLEPDPKLSYQKWLLKRGRAHFGEQPSGTPERLSENVMKMAAEQLVMDRRNVVAAGLPPPGLAEYIDLLGALDELAPNDETAQIDWLRKLNAYVYLKHPAPDQRSELSQQRSPQAIPAALPDEPVP